MDCFGTYFTHAQTCNVTRVVTAQNGQTIEAGTQCLDVSWAHMKRFIPNSITTKDAATALLHGDNLGLCLPVAMAFQQP